LVAIIQGSTCLTILTWNQFVPRLADFGRRTLPRKWGRLLRRISGALPVAGDETAGLEAGESEAEEKRD
jgi:hypothetical protein